MSEKAIINIELSKCDQEPGKLVIVMDDCGIDINTPAHQLFVFKKMQTVAAQMYAKARKIPQRQIIKHMEQ